MLCMAEELYQLIHTVELCRALPLWTRVNLGKMMVKGYLNFPETAGLSQVAVERHGQNLLANTFHFIC